MLLLKAEPMGGVLLQQLKVWAYPKTPQLFEDALVCCVKENPEPITFKLSCHGVRPELELDKKQLQFERVLLHRYAPAAAATALHYRSLQLGFVD